MVLYILETRSILCPLKHFDFFTYHTKIQKFQGIVRFVKKRGNIMIESIKEDSAIALPVLSDIKVRYNAMLRLAQILLKLRHILS